MPITANRTHKHFQLDSAKIKRAQKVLRAKTETEASERFVKSGIEIKDVYETLVG
jgi:hypothetical protein